MVTELDPALFLVDFTAIILIPLPIEETPIVLFVCAPVVPATCVPWLKAVLGGFGLLSLSPTSYPLMSSMYPLLSSSIPLPGISPGFTHNWFTKSGCPICTALSVVATTTLEFPKLTSHAWPAFILNKPHAWVVL